jgi:hypothetical protein
LLPNLLLLFANLQKTKSKKKKKKDDTLEQKKKSLNVFFSREIEQNVAQQKRAVRQNKQ